jgi:hypothetical protein
MPGMGASLGQFFKPEDLLNAYKNMECEVPDGTAIVAINRYRNANKPSHAEGGTQESWPLRLSLLGVAPDTIKRTGGNKLWADCFLGKGSPWAIARVLECFVAYSDQWIARFKKAHAATPERKIADWLSDDNLSWEAALQKISDGWFGTGLQWLHRQLVQGELPGLQADARRSRRRSPPEASKGLPHESR